MPELPEVETIRRSLEPHILGRSVQAVEIRHAHVTGGLSPRAFAAAVTGRTVAGLRRRGKYLVFELVGPRDGLHMVCHLRMTGRLRYLPPRARWTESPEHTHAVLRLSAGGRLIFHDVRKFGRLLLADGPSLEQLLPSGRDPVLEGLDGPVLAGILGGRQGVLKGLLLRQDLLCGLGNIYADEALHRAGIHPLERPAALGSPDWERLAEGITAVLGEALAFRGTTLMDYRSGDGERGAFGRYLRVYGRAGAPCRHCGTPIAAIRVAGRTSAFCAHCQPVPAAPGACVQPETAPGGGFRL